MILMASLIGNWEKMYLGCLINLTVFSFLFMICALEVVLLKITTSPNLGRELDLDDSSEYEEDIYYENLQNNYEQYARRRLRYQRQQQRLHQETAAAMMGSY